MAAMSTEVNLKERLRITRYSRSACFAAIRGEAIPHALGHPLHRLCVIRGIRYHYGFGNELRGLLAVFTRTLNARSIMSNVIPELESPDAVPYCIWHPETASENTYRELVQKYPQLAYQAGRACAVAGYTKLFHELDILPEVHIAEEARECGNLAIYEAIVSQIVRYNVMNDYGLRLDLEAPKPAHLNGDTCVRWMLDIKQQFKDATSDFFEEDDEFFPEDLFGGFQGYQDTMFNITEDMQIDEYESDGTAKRLLASRPNLRWLYEPLPQDLPTVQKDILIAMAAYYGDVDRYSRLRRPKSVYSERGCCVRGIYHNTLFALWWAKQPEPNTMYVGKAINARFIMNNVLSRAPFKQSEIPYLIWWPTPARPATYRRLADIHPEMLPQIVRACIYANYKELFTELLPRVEPDKALIREANSQSNQYFRKALDEAIAKLDIEPQYPPSHQSWKMGFSGGLIEQSSNNLTTYLDADSIGTGFDIPYDGLQCDASQVELMLCLPDAWKIPTDDPDDELYPLEIDYVEWPPGMAAKEE
jgi:hypothetical protein